MTQDTAVLAKHLTKIRVGDLVAVRYLSSDSELANPKAQEYVLRVTKVLDDSVVGIEASKAHMQPVKMTVPFDSVLINFGPHPQLKLKMFGADFANLFTQTTFPHESWPLHWFYQPEDQDIKAMDQSAIAMRKWLKANGLLKMLDLPLSFEVTSKKGKHTGMFIGSKDYRKKPARIQVNINQYLSTADGPDGSLGASSPTYVLAHELGHALRFMLLHRFPKHVAKWVLLHEETVSASSVTAEELDDIRAAAMQSANFREWKAKVAACGEASEGVNAHKEAFTLLGAYMNRVRGIPTYSLEALFLAENQQAVADLIPNHEVLTKRLESPILTQYATVSPEELAAEAFAYRVLGAKLPPKLDALMDDFLRLAAKALPRVLADIKELGTEK